MGELIAEYVRCGWRVEAVLVTDGADSGARVGINRILAAEHLPPMSIPAFVQAREREFVAALAQLGVSAAHVHFAGWHGDQLTVAEAAATIRAYAARFPGALHITMSEWDLNPDHRALGTALAQLSRTDAHRWVVFHRYWASATFRQNCRIVDVPFTVAAVRAAAAVYARWDPTGGWYAIGVMSVWRDFRVLRADPRDLVCTTPGIPMSRRPGSTPAPKPPASPSPTPTAAASPSPTPTAATSPSPTPTAAASPSPTPTAATSASPTPTAAASPSSAPP